MTPGISQGARAPISKVKVRPGCKTPGARVLAFEASTIGAQYRVSNAVRFLDVRMAVNPDGNVLQIFNICIQVARIRAVHAVPGMARVQTF